METKLLDRGSKNWEKLRLAVTARFDAEELITKRDQVADQALAGLRRYLEPRITSA